MILVSGFSVLWEAIVAVNRPSFGWLEWNVTFLSAICACCFMHFAGPTKGALTAVLTTASAPVIVSVVHEINSD